MAIKDYLPSLKSVGLFAAGAVLGGGLVAAAGSYGAFQEEFIPSKATCSSYYETRNGRFVCVIHGRKGVPEGFQLPKEVTPVKKPVKRVKPKVEPSVPSPLPYQPRHKPW